MTETTNNWGVSHESGAIETTHGSLKHRIDQAIKLRGCADFDNLADYQALIDLCIERLNRYTLSRFQEEQTVLRPLPADRLMLLHNTCCQSDPSSTIAVKHGLYTVPSFLIGETHQVYRSIMTNSLALSGKPWCFVLNCVYPDSPTGCTLRIDYRHVIHPLTAKLQALRFLRFRDELFPDNNYRQLWQLIDQQFATREPASGW